MEERRIMLRDMKICRFCFHTNENDLTSIYQKEVKAVPLPVQIMSCVSIEEQQEARYVCIPLLSSCKSLEQTTSLTHSYLGSPDYGTNCLQMFSRPNLQSFKSRVNRLHFPSLQTPTVFPNDGFPQQICNICRQQTNQSYIFKSNCKKADDALKNFLQSGELIDLEIVKSSLSNLKRHPASKVITPIKDVRIVANKSPSLESPKIKRTKLDDGTEVVTLSVPQPESTESQDESSQDSIEESLNTNAEHAEETYNANRFDDPLHIPEIPEQVQTDIFSCQYCERSFPLKQLLELHVTTRHRERQFACAQCDNKFFTKYDMMKHQSTHSEHKPFSCSVCGKDFAREALLRRHEQTHNEAPKYLCLHCDRTFLVKDDLDNHAKKHDKKRPFVCETCDKSFVFKQGLERHINSVHAQDRPHKCNYCDASFNSQIRLTRHITTHAGLRPYPCKICGRTFLLSHHLTRHMRSHYAADQGRQPEEAVGQHKCDICSMSFKRKDSLINHSAIHSMVNLRCVICNTSFENAKMVKEHITTHLQGLSYPCDRCDYSFETQDQLEEHELKHAEMEYEEQIEQEVISEVNQIRNQMSAESNTDDERFVENGEVINYRISDIPDPTTTIIPRSAASPPFSKSSSTSPPDFGRSPPAPETTDGLNQFFKTEISETEEGEESSLHVTGEDDEQENCIRPIFRVEGTKMYERKGPIQRRIPKVQVAQPTQQHMQTVPLDMINEPLNMGAITQEALSNLPSKKPVNVKVGDKVVKVQKFIISKEEMKQMAKLGILELKNGQVTMKNPGQPILNAVIKPVQQSDIESLLNSQRHSIRTPIKQYERRAQSSQSFSENKLQRIIEDFN